MHHWGKQRNCLGLLKGKYVGVQESEQLELTIKATSEAGNIRPFDHRSRFMV